MTTGREALAEAARLETAHVLTWRPPAITDEQAAANLAALREAIGERAATPKAVQRKYPDPARVAELRENYYDRQAG